MRVAAGCQRTRLGLTVGTDGEPDACRVRVAFNIRHGMLDQAGIPRFIRCRARSTSLKIRIGRRGEATIPRARESNGYFGGG